MSHRICLCDVLIESDRRWTSWTSVGLTSKAFSAAQLPVPRLVGGGWEFFSEKSYSAPETTIPHPATQLTASEDSFILFSLPEVSQKTFFFVSLSTVSCALGTITAAAPSHPPASTRAPSHGTGGLRVR